MEKYGHLKVTFKTRRTDTHSIDGHPNIDESKTHHPKRSHKITYEYDTVYEAASKLWEVMEWHPRDERYIPDEFPVGDGWEIEYESITPVFRGTVETVIVGALVDTHFRVSDESVAEVLREWELQARNEDCPVWDSYIISSLIDSYISENIDREVLDSDGMDMVSALEYVLAEEPNGSLSTEDMGVELAETENDHY